MTSALKEKIANLENFLSGFKKLAIAFSGGIDSAFLLYKAQAILGKNVVAFTINSAYIPENVIEDALNFTQKHKILHEVLNIPLIEIIRQNPSNRCYYCKSFIFNAIQKEALKHKIHHIAEGSISDDHHHIAGLKALNELKIDSPLKHFNFTRDDMNELADELDLPQLDQPSQACLLTRLPYGAEITDKDLARIKNAEIFLAGLGLVGARVQNHDNLARIEIIQDQMEAIFKKETFEIISNHLKQLGYQYVTIDLEGYSTNNTK